MKVSKKIAEGILDWLVSDNKTGKVIIDNDSLNETLSTNHLMGYRFTLLVATMLFMFVSVVYYAVTFFKDVILYDTEIAVNTQGTLTLKKSLNRDYHLFLFNPHEPWANSGIRINKGDKYRINISGGNHASVMDAIDRARDNIVPTYGWVFSDSISVIPNKWKSEDNWKLSYCLSRHIGERDSCYYDFGSVLYTVMPEDANLVYNPLVVSKEKLNGWQPNESSAYITSDESGFLYMAVNDLVFGESEGVSPIDNIEKYIKEGREMYSENYEPQKKLLKDDYSALYSDNIGQILVAVEIKRDYPGAFSFFNPMCAYRWLEEGLSMKYDSYGNNLLGLILKVLWTIIYGFVFLLWIVLIFGLRLLKIWVIVSIIYLPLLLFGKKKKSCI